MTERLIKLPEVISLTGLSSSSIYRLAGEGSFPRPVKILSRSSGWAISGVNKWIDERIKASRPDATEA